MSVSGREVEALQVAWMKEQHTMSEHEAKVVLNTHRAKPNTRELAEEWLKDLGVRFTDVWFFHPHGDPQWVLLPQVDDPMTFAECLRSETGRSGAHYALWHNGTSWSLMSRLYTTKTYPSREAAEMVAIHRG